MKVSESVRKAIDDCGRGELEAAMLHACNAVDGTAKKLYPDALNKDRFTRLLRENYAILGPMGAPGINLVETRFPVTVKNPTAPGGKPDAADVLYGIHRCCHAHGEELPDGFDLVRDTVGPPHQTAMFIERGKVRVSDRMIFGLLAVAVLSSQNSTQASPGLNGYFLTYGNTEKLMINEWWGRASDFADVAARDPPPPSVLLDFSNWTNP